MKKPDGGMSYAKLVEKGAASSTDDELRAAAKYARSAGDPEMHQHARAELYKRQQTGKRGGRYYLTAQGKKVYIKS